MLALIRTGQKLKRRSLMLLTFKKAIQSSLMTSEDPRPHAKELALVQDMDVLQDLLTTQEANSEIAYLVLFSSVTTFLYL